MSNINITQLLCQYSKGQLDALDQLFPLIFSELKVIARKQLRKVSSVETISTTALVNEVYLKLVGKNISEINNRLHFYAIAAKAMRQILLNYAEHKNAEKRGGKLLRISLENVNISSEQNIETLICVNEAIDKLETIDENLAKIVELKFFCGLTEEEIATSLKVSDRTVRRNWQKAKALLASILERTQTECP